jgi:hypothetical protein
LFYSRENPDPPLTQGRYDASRIAVSSAGRPAFASPQATP